MMKIGITYLYTISQYGYPPKIEDDFKSLEEIRGMGFKYLEMEGLGVKHNLDVAQNKEKLKKVLDLNDIHVYNFCGVDPDLVSLDKGKREKAFENFKITADTAAYLETETLHLASYAAPVDYLKQKPYSLDKEYGFEENVLVHIPKGFDFSKLWETLVISCQFCSDVAARYGKTVIMEPRVGEIICSSDSMLRLIKDVGRSNFKANFDTAHFQAQREILPITLEKLKGEYANFHIADNNPINQNHIAIGEGTIDWEEFFRLLLDHGYDGYLGIDLSCKDTIKDDLQKSVKELKSLSEKFGFHLDI